MKLLLFGWPSTHVEFAPPMLFFSSILSLFDGDEGGLSCSSNLPLQGCDQNLSDQARTTR